MMCESWISPREDSHCPNQINTQKEETKDKRKSNMDINNIRRMICEKRPYSVLDRRFYGIGNQNDGSED